MCQRIQAFIFVDTDKLLIKDIIMYKEKGVKNN